jgi:hypothetical protein
MNTILTLQIPQKKLYIFSLLLNILYIKVRLFLFYQHLKNKIMYKLLLKISFIGMFSIMFFSCIKKSDPNSSSAPGPTGSQFTFNGTTYAAGIPIVVLSDTSYQQSNFNPTVPSGGGYLSYTGSTTVFFTKLYEYTFAQINIPSIGNTIIAGFELASLTPIVIGTYNIYGAQDNPTSYPFAEGAFANTSTIYKDSTVTGTLNITAINTSNKTISGNYSYTATGAKGSNPASVSITNGKFNNIAFQEF